MDKSFRELLERIHDSPWRLVMAVTGGGTSAIGQLLGVPGGSRTLLEACVPYDSASLVEFLGYQAEHASSAETAIAMARRARERSVQLCHHDVPLIGLGATASLASDRPKKGDHRCHIATDRGDSVRCVSIVLAKGLRDRAAEEQVIAREIVRALAAACDVPTSGLESLLEAHDTIGLTVVPTSHPLDSLLGGSIDRVTVLPDGQWMTGAPVPHAVLAGSFNPVHAGHLGLARVASEMLEAPVSFEISVLNVDKPPLSRDTIRRRAGQFTWQYSVELTRAATFLEKSRALPGTTFVVGADTGERIVDARYYGSEAEMMAALAEITSRGCRFLVAGRALCHGRFQALSDIVIPPAFTPFFEAIPETRFRTDVSSSEVRDARFSKQIL